MKKKKRKAKENRIIFLNSDPTWFGSINIKSTQLSVALPCDCWNPGLGRLQGRLTLCSQALASKAPGIGASCPFHLFLWGSSWAATRAKASSGKSSCNLRVLESVRAPRYFFSLGWVCSELGQYYVHVDFFIYIHCMSKLNSSIKESSVISSISQPHPCYGVKSSICNLPDITLKDAWGWGDREEKVSTAGSAWNPGRWSQPSKPYPGSKVYLFVCFNHRPFFSPLFNSRFFEHKNNVFSSITKFWILGRYCRFLIHNEVSISVHPRVHDQPVRTFPKRVFFYGLRMSCLHTTCVTYFGYVHYLFLAFHFLLYLLTTFPSRLHMCMSTGPSPRSWVVLQGLHPWRKQTLLPAALLANSFPVQRGIFFFLLNSVLHTGIFCLP